MNEKIEYADGKSSFLDKCAVFGANKNTAKNNINQSKKDDENNIRQSKTSNNLSQNILNQHKEEKKTKINKQEGKKKENNIVLNNINKINEKENKKKESIKIISNNEKMDNKNDKLVSRSSSFQVNLNVFNQSNKENKDNKEKTNKNEKNCNNNTNIKETPGKSNNKKEINKTEEKNNISKENNNNNVKDRANIFEQTKNDNNKSIKTFQKENLNKNFKFDNIDNEYRNRSITLNNMSTFVNQNKQNNINKENKKTKIENNSKANIGNDKKENSKFQNIKNKFENNITKTDEKNLKKDEKKKEEQIGNKVKNLATNFYSKDKNENIIKAPSKFDNKIVQNNSDLKKNEEKKIKKKEQITKNNKDNSSVHNTIQNLLLKFDKGRIEHKNIEKKNINNSNILNNNNLKKNNDSLDKNNNLDNNKSKTNYSGIKANEKEKEKEKVEGVASHKLISTKTEMDNQTKNTKKLDDPMCDTSVTKKLTIKEILKNMNIDQGTPKIMEKKREEIFKLAQKKKEEDNNIINLNETEIESDNENEEKEKEEIDKDLDTRISVGAQNSEHLEDPEQIEKIFIDEPNEDINFPIINANFENEKEEQKLQRLSTISLNSPPSLEKKFQINNDNIEINTCNDNKKNNKSDLNNENKINKNKILEENINIKNIKQNPFNHMIINQERNSEEENKRKLTQPIIAHDSKPLNKKLSIDSRNTVSYFQKMDFLENEDVFLEKITLSQEKTTKNESFCESFFLASFSKENGKIMDNSEGLRAECDHDDCSILPAIIPELIYKYPKEDIKGLEINNLAASICFPNGIKLCYEQNEKEIKTVKNYRSSFTNQVGERFFAVVYHFYLKMELTTFDELYKVDPIKFIIKSYSNEMVMRFNDELLDDVSDKLKKCDELSLRDYIYIPYCLCLISRYPFIEQMEKCLESIMVFINSNNEGNEDDLNKLISYIVKSIPAPRFQSKIVFPLPYLNKFIEIEQPYFKDITEFGSNPIIIFYHLSINHFLYLFKLLIFEQKVLIVGKDNDTIAQIVLNFVSLLYPFEWIHTSIPIMSEKMIKFLQAFLPFFNGTNIKLLPKAIPILAKAAKGVYIFNIDDDTININSNYNSNNKRTKASSYIKKHFKSFPKNIDNLLIKELKSIISNHKNAYYDKYNANLRIKNLFIHVFVELLQDYKKYSYIIDDYPVFNSSLMVKEKKSDKDFFKDFSSTQLFQMYIQNSLFNDKPSYFQERLADYNELKNKGYGTTNIHSKSFDKLKKDYSSFFTIKKNYIIKPFFIKELDDYYKNRKMKYKNMTVFLMHQYERQNYSDLNSHGVLKENKRIVLNSIDLNNENDPKNYDIYLFPDQNEEDIINNTPKKKSTLKKTKTIKIGIISGEENQGNNIVFSQNVSGKENELTEDERDEIKDDIREIMTRVYRSEVNKIKEDEKNIFSCVKLQFGREYFISILNTGNIVKREIKSVIEESFYFFNNVILEIILNYLKYDDNKNNIICAMKLLKASLCIKSIINKKEILLCDILFDKLYDYSLLNIKLFWEIWVEDEMSPSDIKILKLKKQLGEYEPLKIEENNEEYISYLDHSYEIIRELPILMMKMKKKNSLIIDIIDNLRKEYIIIEEKSNSLMREVIEEIKLFENLTK